MELGKNKNATTTEKEPREGKRLELLRLPGDICSTCNSHAPMLVDLPNGPLVKVLDAVLEKHMIEGQRQAMRRSANEVLSMLLRTNLAMW